MSELAIDLDDVLERVQDDRELLVELLDIFSEDYILKRQQFAECLAQRDFDKIRDIAHSLKGAAGNISARRLHATCLNIEEQADAKDAGAIQDLFARMEEQFSEFQKFVQGFKATQG